VQFIEKFDEREVSDLFDHGERVGDAAEPEVVPDSVEFETDFACCHKAAF
jgi:hypothetical protein